MQRRKEKVKIQAIRKITYSQLSECLRCFINDNKKILPLSVVSRMMRERMHVMELIRALTYGIGLQNVETADIFMLI